MVGKGCAPSFAHLAHDPRGPVSDKEIGCFDVPGGAIGEEVGIERTAFWSSHQRLETTA